MTLCCKVARVWYLLHKLGARVAELVDAGDLKSPGVFPRAGSIPASSTDKHRAAL